MALQRNSQSTILSDDLEVDSKKEFYESMRVRENFLLMNTKPLKWVVILIQDITENVLIPANRSSVFRRERSSLIYHTSKRL